VITGTEAKGAYTMKGLVKYEKGPGNMKVMEMPEPVCGPGSVKIRVEYTGICGSDLHIRASDIAIPVNPPVITGHEFSGVVTEVGEEVTNCKVGDRVTSETAYSYCGECYNCKSGRYNLCNDRKVLGYWYNGAFAPYTMVPSRNIHILPDTVSFEEGAMIEPMACVTHAAMNLASIDSTDTVLVTGPGAIGLIALQVAKSQGAKVIVSGTSIDEPRLALARELGADVTVDVLKEDLEQIVARETGGIGVDVVLECSGSEKGSESGLKAVKKQGQFVQIGLAGRPITLPFDLICYKEIKVTGSLGSIWSSWKKAISLLEMGKVNLKILAKDTFTLDEWETAFEKFEKKEGLKILIRQQ